MNSTIVSLEQLQAVIDEFPPKKDKDPPGRNGAHHLPRGTTVEEIERALSYCPAHFGPDSYGDWFKALAAVHSEFPGPDGIALCERYIPGKDGEIQRKFEGLDQGNGVGIGTLYYIAAQYGYRPRRSAPRYIQEATRELTDTEICAIVTGDLVLPFDIYEYRAEDGGILDAWLDHYSQTWLYVTGYDTWYDWQDTHWEQDLAHGLDRKLADLLSAMNWAAKDKLNAAYELEEAAQKSAVKKATAYLSATRRSQSRINSVGKMARGFRAIPGAHLNLGNQLNLANGTLDLISFSLRSHSRDTYFTYCLPYVYDPEARSTLWEDVFVRTVLVEEDTTTFDAALAARFQELYGYSLTTDTSHEIMVWLYGDGGNGKTVAVEILKALLGHMAVDVDFQTLGLPGNYDLAKLPGSRVAFSTESERGGSVAEGYLKRVASGETISARPIYGSPFEFKSTAKIWWAMNDRPVIKSTSNSLWRRLKLIPFNREFRAHEKDTHLLAKLLDELPGILNWALAGLRRLRKNGHLTPSIQSDAALAEYISESNPVGIWLEERTIAADEPITAAHDLYNDYRSWCGNSGRNALNETNFGRELKRLKVTKGRTKYGNTYALFLSKANDVTELFGL